MAKKRRYQNNIINNVVQPRRDLSSITNRHRLPRRSLLPALIKASGEDLRQFHPNKPFRRLRRLSGLPLVLKPRVRERYTRSASGRPVLRSLSVALEAPRDAVICARRNIRREVLFANRKAGLGGQRRPRYNEHSAISCRR